MSESKAKAARAETVIEQVTMEDGREVGFAGKRRLNKSTEVIDGQAHVRFDLRNGKPFLFNVAQSGLLIELACHGASQKIGDETAGETDLDDMAVAIEDMIARLNRGEWTAKRTGAGDSFSGASVVIRAICEVTGKSVEEVKAYLQRKLDEAEAAGNKLTRRALYDSFRAPNSKTGVVIERLEREKAAKTPAVDADALLADLA